MSQTDDRNTPLIFWPFVAIWRLLTLVLEITSRIVCAALGLVLTALGVAATLSVVGAPIGLPLAIFGILLMFRSIF